MNKAEVIACMLVVLRNTGASEEILVYKAKDAGANSKQADAFVSLIIEESDLLDDELKFSLGRQMCYSFFGEGSRGRETFLVWSRANLSPSSTLVMIQALWSDEACVRSPKVPQ